MEPEQLLPISALQHLLFCERQCALIHLERQWSDNRLTAEGNLLHQHVHEQGAESRGDIRLSRGLQVRSLALGIAGVVDAVEFSLGEDGVELAGLNGRWIPFPVEYKRGKPKENRCDEVQLCAQALCLEEMLNAAIPRGALFYGLPRRRQIVAFDSSLRNATRQAIRRLKEIFLGGKMPTPVADKRCQNCSLQRQCMPDLHKRKRSVKDFLARELRIIAREEHEKTGGGRGEAGP